MTVTIANLPYTFCPASSSASAQGFMFKNAYDAFWYAISSATSTQITDIDYPGYHPYQLSSLTSSGAVATATTSLAIHGLKVNDWINVVGASQAGYNLLVQVASVPAANQFTYAVAAGLPTPATTSTLTVSALTSSGTVATATTSVSHGLVINSQVTIAGATPAGYNGTVTITGVPAANQFTYNIATTLASPATGAITAATILFAVGGRQTVPGIVWLDSTFYVMDQGAVIYGSDLNNALSWNALNFITAAIEPGSGKALAKTQNYVIAFKEWSTEFFYDAGNATGSPLSTAGNGFNLIGCANGDSVANLDGILFWVSQTRQKGRGVHMMMGLQEQQISTPDIERILNLSTLATIYSFGVKIAGHSFYILTLVDLNITIAYDLVSKAWAQWSSLTLGAAVNVTSITLSGTTATVITAAPHGLTDGDPVNIAGANQSAYNGIKVISYVDASTFTFQTTAGTTTPATGTITATPYTETYFKYTKYVNALGKDLVQHETSGTLCELSESSFSDVGIPINVLIRTGKIDGGTVYLKKHNIVEVIGNKIAGTAYIRKSDDDYVTFSKYRPVNLNLTRSVLSRFGSARRRSYDLRYLDATSLQLASLDIDMK